MPAFGGAQVKIGGSESSATPAPTPTPTKTGGAFGGLDVKIGATVPKTSAAPAAPAPETKPLPTEPPQPKAKENIFTRTFASLKSGIESLTGGSKPKGAKSMEFPVMTTDLKPQDLDARLKDLDTRQSEITAARANVNLNDQKSIDEYNAKVSQIESDSETYNKDADTLNTVARAHQALGIALYPGMDKNHSTIGPDLGGGVAANEFENARMQAGYPAWAVRNSFTKIVDPIIEDSLQKGDAFVRTLDSSYTPAQRFGAGLEAVAGVGNALFAPISGVIGVAAQKSDLVGLVSQLLSVPGQLASTVTGMAVASLPISEQTKDAISPGLQDIAALITDILTAEKAGKEITPEIREKIGMVKEKIADVQTRITKDIVTRYTPGGTVYFDAAKVKDIWQTSKLLTDAEKSDVLGVIGGDQAKLKNSLKNGISIEISPRELVTLQDKPYWAKIKKYFGIESIDTVVRDVGATARQTVRGYLPAAGASSYSPALHPSLKEDLVDALGTHDAETIKNELVTQLHVNPIKADAIVRKIQQEQAMKDPGKLAQEILQLTAPEPKVQIEAPRAFGGSKVEVGKVADANKALNEENTKKIVESTLNGEREEFRLDNPEQIERSSTVLPENPTPETRITIYRAATEGIKEGDHVTLSEKNAEKYASQREGSTVQKIEVPVKDLVKSDGLGNEFVYAPKTSLKTVGGSGETVASRTAKGLEARAIEKKLTDKPFESLSSHERAVMSDQRTMAEDLLKNDRERALRVALGEDSAPSGMLSSVIFKAVVKDAQKTGDIDLIMKLANSNLNEEVSAAAQNLRGMAEFRDENSAVEVVKRVTKERKAAVEKKTKKAGSVEKAKEKIVERAKKQIAKRKSPIQLKDVEAFIDLLEC